MCDYQGYEFGGRYLDSVCIDGRLFDADACDEEGQLYDHGDNIPCPMCHPRDAVKYHAESNYSSGKMTKKEASASAKFLVLDIRKNRGVEGLVNRPTKLSKTTSADSD